MPVLECPWHSKGFMEMTPHSWSDIFLYAHAVNLPTINSFTALFYYCYSKASELEKINMSGF